MLEPIHVADDAKAALSVAGENAGIGSELALASGKVIAMRGALGVKGMADPMHADYGELARILPEKAEAFSTAAGILFQRASEVANQVMMFAMNEQVHGTRATMAMAACRSPAAIVATQSNLATAWLGRAMLQLITLAAMGLGSQEEAIAPFYRIVTANADRLSR